MAKFKKSDFRPTREWIDALAPESKARIKAGAQRLIEATHLAEIRKALTVTQTGLAERTGLKQAEISRIENNISSIQLKTLERYVEGLGGRVRIVADFPDGTWAEIPVKSGRPVKSRAKIAMEGIKERA
jgi:DNA-binding Xre family transcriptional regulator